MPLGLRRAPLLVAIHRRQCPHRRRLRTKSAPWGGISAVRARPFPRVPYGFLRIPELLRWVYPSESSGPGGVTSILSALTRWQCRTSRGRPVEGVPKEGRRPAEAVVASLLVIVSRTEPSRLTYLKHVFASDTAEVILDRRVDEGRAATEKPDEGRRKRGITKDLQTDGWAGGRG